MAIEDLSVRGWVAHELESEFERGRGLRGSALLYFIYSVYLPTRINDKGTKQGSAKQQHRMKRKYWNKRSETNQEPER